MGVLPSTKYRNNERTVSGNVVVENSDALINVDTSSVACTINLQEIPTNYWSTLYKLYIKDLSGNCFTNNITIVAPTGFKINNQQSIVLNQNSISAYVIISSNVDYSASFISPSITEIPIIVANTVYVMKNGSDTTGLVERFDKPFLTITGAVDAIRAAYPDAVRNYLNRVKVIVEDGTYDEFKIYLYPYIDFDFGNSVIKSNITDSFPSTVIYPSNPNNDFTTKISGNARIYRSIYSQTISIGNSLSRILIQCDTISSNSDDAIAFFGGYLRVCCNKIYQDSISNINGHAIQLQQYVTDGGVFSKSTLEIVGATIFILNNLLATTINFANIGSDFSVPMNQTLSLYNCTVLNELGSSINNELFSAISSGTTFPTQYGSTLNLYNTVLYSKYGKSIFVSNSKAYANLVVNYYNSNSANNAPYLATTDTTHTLTEYIGNLLIDSNVLPIIP